MWKLPASLPARDLIVFDDTRCHQNDSSSDARVRSADQHEFEYNSLILSDATNQQLNEARCPGAKGMTGSVDCQCDELEMAAIPRQTKPLVTPRLLATGPFYGWIIVAASMVITASSGPGQSYLFSVFIDPIIADTGLSRTVVSSLYAAGTFVSAGMVYLISRLADRKGPRWTLTLVALGFGAACIAMAFAQGWLLLSLALASLRGLGQGALPINSTLLIAQWFVRMRGRAMAIYGLGAALSTALLPPVARLLIEHVGWRGAYFVFGLSIWAILLPLAVFVIRNRPEDIGQHPDGASTPPVGEVNHAITGLPDRRNVLRTRMFWLLALPIAIPSLVDTALIFHQTSLFAERGIGAGVAATVFVPFAVATALSNFASGFLVDRIGPKNLFLLGMAVLALPPIVIRVIDSPSTAVVYAVILGVGSGMQAMVSRITWAHYYGRHGLGQVQGSAMMVMIVSSALGPVTLAALRDRFDGYGPGLTLMAVLIVVSALLMARFSPGSPVAVGVTLDGSTRLPSEERNGE